MPQPRSTVGFEYLTKRASALRLEKMETPSLTKAMKTPHLCEQGWHLLFKWEDVHLPSMISIRRPIID